MGQAARKIESASVGWLIEAMTRMIRPIVRFAIGRVSCNALVDLLRESYVEEAREYLQQQHPDRKVTRSALALLCGLDGRQIKAFEDTGGREYAAADICSEAAILETWITDDDFRHSETGEPSDLLIHGPHGTFQRLVSRAAGRAVTPQTALEKLIEGGNVELNDAGTHVRLINPSYMLVPVSAKSAIEAGSFAFNRLGKAVINNTAEVSEKPVSWLQQDRWSLRIPRQRLDRVRADVRRLLEAHIDEFEGLLESEERNTEEGDATERADDCSLGVGWYYWEEPSQPECSHQEVVDDAKHN